jgi:hypothetical protein
MLNFFQVAAFNVSGETVHRLLKLSVQHNVKHRGHTDFSALERSDQQNFARLYEHLSLFIIDEISMVSNVMLAQINDRLCEIKMPRDNQPFGNINVVVFGDLLQLPPVRGSFCFKKLNDRETRATFGGIRNFEGHENKKIVCPFIKVYVL